MNPNSAKASSSIPVGVHQGDLSRSPHGRLLSTMSLKWRWALLVVMAATVLASLVPSGAYGVLSASARPAISLAEVPLSGPIGCLDASCNKGAPAPVSAPLAIAATCAVVAGVLSLATARIASRNRHRVVALPRGLSLAVFRPPQPQSC